MARGKSTITVKLLGDNRDLSRALGESERRIGSFAKKAGAGLAVAGVAAGAGLAALGTSLDSQLDKIRIGTGATDEQLAGLEASFKRVATAVPTSFDNAGTAIADLNTRLGLTGPALEERSAQFLELSRLTDTDLSTNISDITRVFGDWEIATDSQASTLDQIFRASQASGLGIDRLSTSVVQFGAPLRNLGFGFEDSLALLAQFDKAGVNTEAVFSGLKIGVGKLAKDGEAVPETFRRIVGEITALGPGTEATSLAIDLFGQRAGPDLADAIAGGKFEIGEMLAAITGGSDTIMQAAADTESWTEKWTKFKNRALIRIAPLAEKAFDTIGRAFDKLEPHFERFAEWLEEKIPPMVAAISAWFQRNWPTIRRVVKTAIDGIVAAFNLVKNWVDTNWPAIEETVVGVVEAIRSVIETVSAGIAVIWEKYGDQIRAYTEAVWETIQAVVGGAIKALKGVIDAVTAALRGDWSAFWDGIKNILAGVWEAMTGIVSGAIEGIKALLSAAWETIQTVASRAWESLKSGIADAVGGIVSSVGSLPGEFLGMLSSFFDAAKSIGRRIVGGVTSGLANLGERITAPFRNALNKVIGWWNGLSFTLPTINLPKVETPFGTIGGGSFGGQTFGTPNLPTFHDGGFVGNRNGPARDIPIMAQQGELVLSRSKVAELETAGASTPAGSQILVIDRREAPDWFDPDVDAHIRRIVRDEVAS